MRSLKLRILNKSKIVKTSGIGESMPSIYVLVDNRVWQIQKSMEEVSWLTKRMGGFKSVYSRNKRMVKFSKSGAGDIPSIIVY